MLKSNLGSNRRAIIKTCMVLKWSSQNISEPCKELKKAAEPIYGWDSPLQPSSTRVWRT